MDPSFGFTKLHPIPQGRYMLETSAFHAEVGLPGWLFCMEDKNSPENERMSPENRCLEDVFPIEMVTFLADMLVFQGVQLRNGT